MPKKSDKDSGKKGTEKILFATDPLVLDIMAKQEEDAKKPNVVFTILDSLQKNQSQNSFYTSQNKDKEFRLAFEADPATQSGVYESLYRNKVWLLPDSLIKKIHRSDDLIAAILNTRGNHVAAHGRARESRFDMGFDIVVDKKFTEGKDEDELMDLMERVERAKEKFYTCGDDKGWSDEEKCTLPQFLKMFSVDGLRFGRGATEIIYKRGDSSKFHSFRAVDAGTMYKVAPFAGKGATPDAKRVREQSKLLLERLKGEKIPEEKLDVKAWEQEEYSWVQVIDNIPRQAFRPKEMVVHNFYPSTDIEYAGYPLTPLDTIINAVTTHINIQQHNKLYFASGRAARGMLIVKSDSIDESVIQKIRMQFNASINSVQNAHRMPVFGIGGKDSGDDLTWVPIDGGGAGRDKEFQILSDSNARTILAAFQMSPDELPGYSHLSRATNTQTMSESNNEFKLEAARDVGLRPLLMTIQDFLNERIFPLIDKDLSEKATICLQGLDADDPLKESEKIVAGMGTHLSYNDIMDMVDKKKVEKEWGGDFPLNPRFQEILNAYFTVGEVKARFFDDKEAEEDASLAYYRDDFWIKWQELLLQQQQMELQQEQLQVQQEMMARQPNGGDPNKPGNGAPPNGGGGEGGNSEEEELDMGRGIDQLIGMLSKSEKQLSPSKRRQLAQHRATVSKYLAELEQESESLLEDIMEDAKKFSKKRVVKSEKKGKRNAKPTK